MNVKFRAKLSPLFPVFTYSGMCVKYFTTPCITFQARVTVRATWLPAGTDPERGTAGTGKVAGRSRRHRTGHNAWGMGTYLILSVLCLLFICIYFSDSTNNNTVLSHVVPCSLVEIVP